MESSNYQVIPDNPQMRELAIRIVSTLYKYLSNKKNEVSCSFDYDRFSFVIRDLRFKLRCSHFFGEGNIVFHEYSLTVQNNATDFPEFLIAATSVDNSDMFNSLRGLYGLVYDRLGFVETVGNWLSDMEQLITNQEAIE